MYTHTHIYVHTCTLCFRPLKSSAILLPQNPTFLFCFYLFTTYIFGLYNVLEVWECNLSVVPHGPLEHLLQPSEIIPRQLGFWRWPLGGSDTVNQLGDINLSQIRIHLNLFMDSYFQETWSGSIFNLKEVGSQGLMCRESQKPNLEDDFGTFNRHFIKNKRSFN